MPPLEISQKVQLNLRDNEHAVLGQVLLNSYIADIQKDRLLLAAPMLRSRVIMPAPGTWVTVWATGKTAVFVFESRVLENIGGDQPFLVLEAPQHIVRKQRRAFVRVEYVAPVMVRRLLDNGQADDQVLARGYSRDISGGGVRIVLGRSGEHEGIILVEIEGLPLGGLEARVIRSESCPEANGKYEWGLEFEGLTEAERDQIIKFTFARQREMRKKGLL